MTNLLSNYIFYRFVPPRIINVHHGAIFVDQLQFSYSKLYTIIRLYKDDIEKIITLLHEHHYESIYIGQKNNGNLFIPVLDEHGEQGLFNLRNLDFRTIYVPLTGIDHVFRAYDELSTLSLFAGNAEDKWVALELANLGAFISASDENDISSRGLIAKIDDILKERESPWLKIDSKLMAAMIIFYIGGFYLLSSYTTLWLFGQIYFNTVIIGLIVLLILPFISIGLIDVKHSKLYNQYYENASFYRKYQNEILTTLSFIGGIIVSLIILILTSPQVTLP